MEAEECWAGQRSNVDFSTRVKLDFSSVFVILFSFAPVCFPLALANLKVMNDERRERSLVKEEIEGAVNYSNEQFC